MKKIPVYSIKIPEYTIKKKPNYVKIGKKVDKIIEKNFPNGKYILRAINSDDHPKINLKKLVEIILKIGTDKYDPKRKAVCQDEFSGYDYDIQAGTIEIKNSKLIITKEDKYPSIFGSIAYLFYEHALLDRGHRVRINLLLIYDPKKLKKARKFSPKARGVRKGLNNYLYKFKDEKNKKDALLGIIKILK